MSFRHDGSLLVGGGKDGVAVIEGPHDIPDKVHELIGFGLAGEAADLHCTAQIVDKDVLLSPRGRQTDDPRQRVQTIRISFMNLCD